MRSEELSDSEIKLPKAKAIDTSINRIDQTSPSSSSLAPIESLKHLKISIFRTKQLENFQEPSLMSLLRAEIIMQWIHGRINIPGNKQAAKLAKRGTSGIQLVDTATMKTERQDIGLF